MIPFMFKIYAKPVISVYFQLEMRASSNEATQAMMSEYDSHVSAGRLPCSPEDGVPCDVEIGNDVGFGRDPSLSFGGPDDYVFDKKLFKFMGNRFYSCQLTYFHVPMGVQQMSYGVRKHSPYKRGNWKIGNTNFFPPPCMINSFFQTSTWAS